MLARIFGTKSSQQVLVQDRVPVQLRAVGGTQTVKTVMLVDGMATVGDALAHLANNVLSGETRAILLGNVLQEDDPVENYDIVISSACVRTSAAVATDRSFEDQYMVPLQARLDSILLMHDNVLFAFVSSHRKTTIPPLAKVEAEHSPDAAAFTFEPAKQWIAANGTECRRGSSFVLHAPALIQYMRRHFGTPTLFDAKRSSISTSALLANFTALAATEDEEGVPECLSDLLDAADEQRESLLSQKELHATLAAGRVLFGDLWSVFEGREVYFEQAFSGKVAGLATKGQYCANWDGSQYLQITLAVIKTNGTSVYHCTSSVVIGEYAEARSLSDLPLKMVDLDLKAKLTERGRFFRQIATGMHFRQYEGSMLVTPNSYSAPHSVPATGRVVVDGASMCRLESDAFQFAEEAQVSRPITGTLKDDVLWMTWPTVSAFSLASVTWGEVVVSGLSDIQFDEGAYDELVLDPESKEIVRALVDTYTRGKSVMQSDLIKGKGAGCIFLLHGAPGTGKTLTSEAIAELLQRPLYNVSAGELGSTIDAVTKKLKAIMTLAETWKAVVLLDEADMFLAERNATDLQRNSICCTFLKQSEYFSGVMFLTTNRAASLDPAMKSRIAVSIEYPTLDAESRAAIWRNQLKRCQCAIDDDTIKAHLASYPLNGRAIRLAIRTAHSIAEYRGTALSLQVLEMAAKRAV